jgi:hypothetical protein
MINPASLPTGTLIDIYRQLGEGDETAIMKINEELATRSDRGDLAAIAFFGDDV